VTLDSHATRKTASGRVTPWFVRKPPRATTTSEGVGGKTFSSRVAAATAR